LCFLNPKVRETISGCLKEQGWTRNGSALSLKAPNQRPSQPTWQTGDDCSSGKASGVAGYPSPGGFFIQAWRFPVFRRDLLLQAPGFFPVARGFLFGQQPLTCRLLGSATILNSDKLTILLLSDTIFNVAGNLLLAS
jgi:hypothetical protein